MELCRGLSGRRISLVFDCDRQGKNRMRSARSAIYICCRRCPGLSSPSIQRQQAVHCFRLGKILHFGYRPLHEAFRRYAAKVMEHSVRCIHAFFFAFAGGGSSSMRSWIFSPNISTKEAPRSILPCRVQSSRLKNLLAEVNK